ncbi:hypothetical protein LCGC14_0587880 [marine sediment metagenome]|uniref:Uncharacterized protein n=1 Tax=marine sediment metagenome TaxID=412755 RepID=A0A0F9REI6_9ZZZZ
MKIGKPTTGIPQAAKGSGRFMEVWKAAEALKSGQSLPVEFADAAEAHTARVGMVATAGRKGLFVRQRGTTIYITKNGAN